MSKFKKFIASLKLLFRSFWASLSSKESIICATRTDKGARSSNQDSLYLVRWHGNTAFGVVADGMGYTAHGKLAARMCTSYFARIFGTKSKFKNWLKQEGFTASPPSFALRKIVADIDRQIHERILATGNEMGTTCTAVLVRDEICWFAHVGDSRLYHLREDLITQITNDHSWVQENLVTPGLISSEEAKSHAEKNFLSNFLGLGEQLKIDVGQLPLSKGDLLLLCSDGLSNELSDSTIKEIATSYPPEIASRRLVKYAKQSAGNKADNISVILIQYKSRGEKN